MAAKKKKKKPTTTKPVLKAKPKAKKKIAKAKAKAKPKPKKKIAKAKPKKKVAVKRRDATGHLDPKYAKKLRALGGTDSGKADSKRGAFRVKRDGLAEELGAEVVDKATSGEDQGEDYEDRVEVEESGGPFVETTGRTEYADGVDDSNPEDAEREPFPKT